MDDLILNPDYAPTFAEIDDYIQLPARALWLDLHGFIQDTFRSKPKSTYSVCQGKPGWNVKYQKSGKSICTLYPEKNCFIALVVISVELAKMLDGANPPLHPHILGLIQNGKPFNNTLWLMIHVSEREVLESLKDLLVFKKNSWV